MIDLKTPVLRFDTHETTYFVHDENGLLIGTYDGTTGDPNDELIYLEDRPVATVRGSTTYRILTDHLKTPRKLIDASNTTVWSWDGKEAFGNTPPTGSLTFNLRFPGQYADVETGLANNGFRDYAPAWGRYVESDPTGLNGGLNTYGYVRGMPTMFADVTGLDLYVAYFNGNPGGNPGGHIGIGVNSQNTVGWYPANMMGMIAGPGSVGNDMENELSKPNVLIKIPTSKYQDAIAQNLISKYSNEFHLYSLEFFDCASFVSNILNESGVSAPKTVIPYVLATYLDNEYGHVNIIPERFDRGYFYDVFSYYGALSNVAEKYGLW